MFMIPLKQGTEIFIDALEKQSNEGSIVLKNFEAS